MTSLDRIKLSNSGDVYVTKMIAKTIETPQTLDLGPFFKVLKMADRNMTSVVSYSL